MSPQQTSNITKAMSDLIAQLHKFQRALRNRLMEKCPPGEHSRGGCETASNDCHKCWVKWCDREEVK